MTAHNLLMCCAPALAESTLGELPSNTELVPNVLHQPIDRSLTAMKRYNRLESLLSSPYTDAAVSWNSAFFSSSESPIFFVTILAEFQNTR